MTAHMVVYMNITDSSWIDDYFTAVPGLLAEYGAKPVAGGREILRLEGERPAPERLAILSFPSLDHIHRFMADERYLPFKDARKRGSQSEIFIFENEVMDGELR